MNGWRTVIRLSCSRRYSFRIEHWKVAGCRINDFVSFAHPQRSFGIFSDLAIKFCWETSISLGNEDDRQRLRARVDCESISSHQALRAHSCKFGECPIERFDVEPRARPYDVEMLISHAKHNYATERVVEPKRKPQNADPVVLIEVGGDSFFEIQNVCFLRVKAQIGLIPERPQQRLKVCWELFSFDSSKYRLKLNLQDFPPSKSERHLKSYSLG